MTARPDIQERPRTSAPSHVSNASEEELPRRRESPELAMEVSQAGHFDISLES